MHRQFDLRAAIDRISRHDRSCAGPRDNEMWERRGTRRRYGDYTRCRIVVESRNISATHMTHLDGTVAVCPLPVPTCARVLLDR